MLVPVPGLPLSSRDKVVEDANNEITSELDKLLKGSETEADTPSMNDGRAIFEARDEAAKSNDPNVPKDLTDDEKAELVWLVQEHRGDGNRRMRKMRGIMNKRRLLMI